MFFGFNLNELLMFPFKEENRKHLYIGIAVSLLAFIVPIAPYIVLFGYGAQIAKQILNNESPHLVAWDDWGKLFKDGLKVFGARFIIGIPILIFVIPIVIVSFIFPFMFENANPNEVERFLPIPKVEKKAGAVKADFIYDPSKELLIAELMPKILNT